MDLLHLPDLLAQTDLAQRRYLEFQRSADLSAGVYVLPAGSEDHQSPHTEDEAYYVMAGRANVVVGEETQPVSQGTFVFVPANVPHRFTDIQETLLLLVVFGPAYRSRQPGAPA